MRIIKTFLTCAALSMASVTAYAAYPQGPVTIIVPYGAGGAVDLIARATASSISPTLGQPVIVQNRPGAGGNVGSAHVARSTPDGLTLLMSGTSLTVVSSLFDDLPFDPMKDLQPIIEIGRAPSVLLVSPESGIKSVAELVELAKQSKEPLFYGHGGQGTATEHLVAELFLDKAGIKMDPIQYKGGVAAMNDLMGGRVTMMFTNLLNAAPMVAGGKLRAIAVAGSERAPNMPDVPTLMELGYPVDVSAWWALFGPAGMPKEAIDKINAATNEALKSGALHDRLVSTKAVPTGGTTAELEKNYQAQYEVWKKILQGLK